MIWGLPQGIPQNEAKAKEAGSRSEWALGFRGCSLGWSALATSDHKSWPYFPRVWLSNMGRADLWRANMACSRVGQIPTRQRRKCMVENQESLYSFFMRTRAPDLLFNHSNKVTHSTRPLWLEELCSSTLRLRLLSCFCNNLLHGLHSLRGWGLKNTYTRLPLHPLSAGLRYLISRCLDFLICRIWRTKPAS